MQEEVQDDTRRGSDIQPAHIREGSRFAVMRSKTVTKSNRAIATSNEDLTAAVAASPTRSLEHIYVDPLPVTIYENERTPLRTKVVDPPNTDYANLPGATLTNDGRRRRCIGFNPRPKRRTSPSRRVAADADDYENSHFLEQKAQQLENDLLYKNEKAADVDVQVDAY
ncbi:uncharacterized protein LOC133491821 isoform X3 [Syngnathoides biaculeatus]|uniref:uncharacterized protein LOC133491821 isoform X3 n=1 Tax=Syngnathoides biaculeatus TaxID=300417 RepID=UPI002ADD89EF|nr:uncharacterized protein LOC133491821 isoform X3 [Syngnathoides biaculeatus]